MAVAAKRQQRGNGATGTDHRLRKCSSSSVNTVDRTDVTSGVRPPQLQQEILLLIPLAIQRSSARPAIPKNSHVGLSRLWGCKGAWPHPGALVLRS